MRAKPLSFTLVLLFSVLSLVSFASLSQAAGEIKTLDGRVYSGQLIRSGDTTGKPDQFIFKNGKLTSLNFERFGEAKYFLNNRGGKASTFVAETASGKDGKIKWIGAVRDNKIEGTSIWYKAGKQPLVYVIKGELQK